ncbi:glycosyltransferase family 4 protein [Photobacterium leiognathi]|uniref:glycosyltransferase family 4 protein n=1 Tax=Photobacterium leiognathi TaxID=553611 RepID=UPI0029822171|nr:glycosyltransferase family 4 protein [Photobacterium leiognathi]
MKRFKNKLIIIHDFDGRPYYKALESVDDVIYCNSRPFRFLLRDIIKDKKISDDVLNSLLLFFFLPFIKRHKILIAMAPLNIRIILYSMLKYRNTVIYHSSWPHWGSYYPFSYSFLNKYLEMIWRKLLRTNYKIICVTKEAQKKLSLFLNTKISDLNQIYHVVDCQEISNEFFDRKWKDINKLNVGFLGRINESKGINEFIEIANNELLYDDVDFYAVGKGAMEDRIIGSGNINYLGFLSNRNDVRKYLSSLNFLLVPSKRNKYWEELFGVVIIEAMSQGIVVITTDHIGPKEIITSGYDGIISTEDEYVSTVIDILTTKDREYYSQVAYNAIVSSRKYSFDKIKNNWSDNVS